MLRLFLLSVMVGAVLAVSACGDDSDETTSVSSGQHGVTTGSGRPSAVTGTSGTDGATGTTPPATQEKRESDTGAAKAPSSKSDTGSSGRHKKLSGIELDLYNQGKVLCGGLPLSQLVSEYKAKSDKPEDVAHAYANAYVPASLPVNRRGFYKGCRDALLRKAR